MAETTNLVKSVTQNSNIIFEIRGTSFLDDAFT